MFNRIASKVEHTSFCIHIMKTRLFKYIENFTSKNWKFSDKNSDIFHISAQNIACGYSLEPPRRGGSNEYPQSIRLSRNNKNNVYPCKPQFYYIKVRFKGVKIISLCLRDEGIPKLSPFAPWPGAMINSEWLELPMSRTNDHCPEDGRTIDVRQYCTRKES